MKFAAREIIACLVSALIGCVLGALGTVTIIFFLIFPVLLIPLAGLLILIPFFCNWIEGHHNGIAGIIHNVAYALTFNLMVHVAYIPGTKSDALGITLNTLLAALVGILLALPAFVSTRKKRVSL